MENKASSNNFYCQKKCGEVGFSIEEWNKAYQELKTLTPEQLDFVMQAETICQEQCSACSEIVSEQRLKTKKLLERNESRKLNTEH